MGGPAALAPSRFATVLAGAAALGRRPRLLFVEGHDARVRAAAETVADLGWARPVLAVDDAGDVAAGNAIDVVDQRRLRDVAEGGADALSHLDLAACAVASGSFDGAVLGATTHSADVLRAGLKWIGTAGRRAVGGAWVDAGAVRGHDVILVDPSVNVRPDPATLASGLATIADLYETITGSAAVIGLASWNSAAAADASAEFGDTVARLRSLGREALFGRPVQVDALLQPDVAIGKGLAFEGDGVSANILGFADIGACNIATKVVEQIGGVPTFAFTTGFRKPFTDVSRSSTVEALVAAAALTAVQCGGD